MKKAVMLLAVLVAVALVAPAAFAQETGAVSGKGALAIAAAFGMALAAFGAALGQGGVVSSACEGMARNPGAAGAIRAAMILGMVFIETLALFPPLMIIIKVCQSPPIVFAGPVGSSGGSFDFRCPIQKTTGPIAGPV